MRVFILGLLLPLLAAGCTYNVPVTASTASAAAVAGMPLYATSAGAGPKTYGLRVGSICRLGELVPKIQYWTRSAQA